MADTPIDIKENDIFELSPELMNLLLRDQTLSTDDCQVNIFWATDNYANKGEGYQYNDQIKLEAITGENGNVIVPRAVKSREQQQQRSRKMAEVFTPSWVCNKQNNLVYAAWFGREGVFGMTTKITNLFLRLKTTTIFGRPKYLAMTGEKAIFAKLIGIGWRTIELL